MSETTQGSTTTAPGATDTTVPIETLPAGTAPVDSAPLGQPGDTLQPPEANLVEDEGGGNGPPAFLLVGIVFFALVTVAILVFLLVGRGSDADPATRRLWFRRVAAVLVVLVLLAVLALAAVG